MPTRISEISATVIDHIYFSPGSKFDCSMLQSGNIWYDLTDVHLRNYLLIADTNIQQKKEPPFFVRLYSDVNILKFKEQVGNINWKDVYESVVTNIAYANFEQKLNTCFINSFPLVRLSRKHTTTTTV